METKYIVRTASGKIRGFGQDGIKVFKGIPYAASPVGQNRFAPPQPAIPWDSLLDASKSGPIVPQPPSAPELRSTIHPQSEDGCLTLNIWTPGLDDQQRPVLFWIHGGSLLTGSNADFNGYPMAARGGVVVIAINYRVGVFGFLFVPGKTANVGLLDQLAALQWVKKNVRQFGGDPDNITIFGESAGGLCVSTLLTMPKAKGLFRRAIIQSNVCNPDASQSWKGEAVAKRLFSALGLEYGDMEALRGVSPDKLVTFYQQSIASRVFADTYPPFVDGEVLPIHPYEAIKRGFARDIEMVAGTNENESGLFSLWDPNIDRLDETHLKNRLKFFRSSVGESDAQVEKFFQVYTGAMKEVPFNTLRYAWEQFNTDQFFRIPTQLYLEAQSKHQARVYAYQFSWKTPELGGKLGAAHALEIPFVFNTLGSEAVGIFPKKSTETERLSLAMMDAWVNFARSGNPNHNKIPEWLPYNVTTRPTMVFDNINRLATNLYPERDRVWQPIF